MTESPENQDSKPTAKSFENAFSELEDVVRKLEAGSLSLDEATSLFESGMKLATKCNEILSTSELKITRLQANFAEQMNLVPDLDENDDEDA
ncbi:MAG TPA: exodeoxyribonuclease VII small subunit [Dehalococcoidia bacterium]|jgi:exodeoxyribonuclease VII small subunit|nr:exodeoxyribonuclease VII small subunit [Chloroflexota bacterium]MDP6056618.1 exodeoxyribonuclease VII small subunit [Dehalococcoidia bacterium]MDP7090102.1 exodeoxyribonuclease VII small subunit [Dehalococcoidia bacterium]MDP7261368.1 exodeoxyribonuclease VII small subunit [Dehalococcoidia bacterium]MDP7485617.1 exodeoxyribonuclease VII small subunit [Dehalococcoidia bacterium]|tara:strand:- start:7614 stop:7889 length:276 start_codon:yes stop_codon:yes gene_type:complete